MRRASPTVSESSSASTATTSTPLAQQYAQPQPDLPEADDDQWS